MKDHVSYSFSVFCLMGLKMCLPESILKTIVLSREVLRVTPTQASRSHISFLKGGIESCIITVNGSTYSILCKAECLIT